MLALDNAFKRCRGFQQSGRHALAVIIRPPGIFQPFKQARALVAIATFDMTCGGRVPPVLDQRLVSEANAKIGGTSGDRQRGAAPRSELPAREITRLAFDSPTFQFSSGVSGYHSSHVHVAHPPDIS
jgi:hypothetical protein